ncbi:hypothetical protein VNI00_017441 [Paramarasmius palmivorus]|uniref:Uncharacterized protein n=1 Tax=Paramarasmius palmivorus TaxID=297713 RepID=A0AAW0B8H5_9AGAR
MNGESYDAESARTVQLEGVAIKSLKDVREPSLDPRVDIITPPSAEDLLDQLVHHKESVEKEGESSGTSDEQEPIYIEFEPGDQRNPMNFSPTKKWMITALACYFTLLSGTPSPSPLTPNTQHSTLNTQHQQPEQQEPTTWVSQA